MALDPTPLGSGVQAGSHLDAAAYPDRSLLICWPPDGTRVNAWVTTPHRWLFLIGDPFRFFYDEPAAQELRMLLPGRKGGSTLRGYRLG